MDDSPNVQEQRPAGEGTAGPLSATIIIVLILLVAGVYFLIQQERHMREIKSQQQTQLPARS